MYPDHWRNSQIQLLHTLFGHTARVWKCLIISSFYVTIGEDSQLIIWKRDGTLLKKLSLHQESGIRGLCFSEKADQIITGGEDGGINEISWNYLMFKCNPFLQGELINTDKTFSTRVCFVKQGYVYTTNGGCVLVNGRKEEFIYKNENFLTYCFLEVSLTGDFVALGSIKGQLVIIDVLKKIVLIDGQYLDGRVYSIHYLDNHLLTCGPQGRLDLWRVSNFALNHVKVLSLPVCKERWTNCALLQNNHLIVGDRMGNIHFYNLNGGEEPVQICRKIHSYLGVSDALDDGNAIFTIGRDGTLKTFTKSLVHSNTYKLPIEWPWKIVNYKGDKLILGFHSINFVVWSMKHREIIASQECGGGHRSCHYVLNGDKLSFIFVKEKKIFLIDLTLNAINRLRIGFHGKVINSLRIINSEIIVTGSEDTTLRISRISKIEIEVLDVLKTHISSVRAIGSCFFEDSKILIVSGGGKAQIVLWRFDVNSLKCEELISFRLKKEDRSWKCETPTADPETRFMCIDILKQKKEFFIAAGCSDCKLRLFLFNESLNLLSSISYSHCILKVAILKVSLAIYLVSMATDGKVVFWQVTESLNVIMSGAFSIHQSGINCFAFEEIDVGKFILATGGDDNKISVSEIRFLEGGVKLNQLWNNSTTHSCQITGSAKGVVIRFN